MRIIPNYPQKYWKWNNNVEKNDLENVRLLYNSANETWPINDAWHQYTSNYIYRKVSIFLDKFATDKSIILNAGSGDTRFQSKGIIYDCDIADKKLQNSPHPVIASIDNLPFADSFFDIIICVGSVLNYADLYSSLYEFTRVLKCNGLLLIEFERSLSAEFWFTQYYGKQIFSKKYHYNFQEHTLWLYSDKYVYSYLKKCQYTLLQKEYFHGMSSIISRFLHNDQLSARWAHYDKYIIPALKYSAHNAMFLFRKN